MAAPKCWARSAADSRAAREEGLKSTGTRILVGMELREFDSGITLSLPIQVAARLVFAPNDTKLALPKRCDAQHWCRGASQAQTRRRGRNAACSVPADYDRSGKVDLRGFGGFEWPKTPAARTQDGGNKDLRSPGHHAEIGQDAGSFQVSFGET